MTPRVQQSLAQRANRTSPSEETRTARHQPRYGADGRQPKTAKYVKYNGECRACFSCVAFEIMSGNKVREWNFKRLCRVQQVE